MAVLVCHALKSIRLDQNRLVLVRQSCFHFRKLALLVHDFLVILKATHGSSYFAIYSPLLAGFDLLRVKAGMPLEPRLQERQD